MSETEPRPSQRGHIPPRRVKLRRTGALPAPRSTVIDAARPDRRHVEGERVRRAEVRLPEPAEQDAQHGIGVRRRADRRSRPGTHPLLVHDDGRRQPLEDIHLRTRQRRHEALHERAIGLVDQPLGLGRDRSEGERALARPRNAGEHGHPALRDLDADVFEVVLAGAVHADQVVAVRHLSRRRLRLGPRGHRSGLPILHQAEDVAVGVGEGAPRGGRRPHSLGASFTFAPAAVTSASFASMSGTCQ